MITGKPFIKTHSKCYEPLGKNIVIHHAIGSSLESEKALSLKMMGLEIGMGTN